MKARKSKLDAHAERLTHWFTPRPEGGEGLTLHAVKDKLAQEHGFAISTARLSSWWESQQQRRLQDVVLGRLASGAQLQSEIDRQFEKNPAPGIERLIEMLRFLAMELSVHGLAKPELLKFVTPMIGEILAHAKIGEHSKDRELEERRVKLLEAKAAQAEQAEAVTKDAALTPEEKAQRYRQIFGMS